MRTAEEIKRQVELLGKEKTTVPEFSAFGDNNWERIDAQIDVLEGRAKAADFYEDETSDEFEDGDNDIWGAAEEAELWLENPNAPDLAESE